MGISSQIFIQTTCRETGVITWVQFLKGLSPKILEGKKTVQNFSRFLTTFDFDREYLRNGSTNRKSNQTVNDGVAHSKNPRKCAYHVTFDLDLDLEHIVDAGVPGDHRVQVWLRSSHLPGRRSDLRKSLQRDRGTDRRRTPRHCISSFLE